MKIAPQKIESFLKQPDAQIRAVLIYGEDHGLIHSHAQNLAQNWLKDSDDPFADEIVQGAELVKEPGRMGDLCNALSLMGGRRLVRVREAPDALVPELKAYMGNANPDCLLILQAGSLSPNSALRKYSEGEKSGIAALPCYVETARDLGRVIQSKLRAAGLQIQPDAETWLAEHLTGDRGLAEAAIDKLITYMGEERQITLSHAQAVIGDAAAVTVDVAAMACFSGQISQLDQSLTRLFAAKTTPVAILRGLQYHARRLAEARAHMDAGMSAKQAMTQLRPPVFWKMGQGFEAQLDRWSSTRLAEARAILVEAEKQCKLTGTPDIALCQRSLLFLAYGLRGGVRR